MEKIKPYAIQDVNYVMNLCPMAVPFVADEKHPSGYHLSEDESFFHKEFIKMDCAWKLRGRHNLKECIFSNDYTDCPRMWDEEYHTKEDKKYFIREIKSAAWSFKEHNK
ncbi:MAG: hypothetical protein US95_C0006G0020 [Candidatus Woesebacteria bacterium GW2011_GWB1_38_5]|uniref:Uncharacterized protein n=4 Tax=Candidatus Woeseibacteriota TaxID=1752722 RepID=A0A0G0KYY1_9BACT|nr:MAG: hypothetical protein US67_C0025G0005 [Candidatus Woesebacteria bacterium GW2011_GWD1_38_10]KKQ55615.1 MAG: hypothetical protein US75_C0017G0009 [Candidatus Woesebacteria bacterium GW2011_GWC1_38_13]KKQ75298.1 MAG: hypothetical protein US95_C0006G0020 [Candidatus Woesebacteria bacterium GW2011_GWB1_38_5]KKQ83952.1 MAG: hypothetical protein UT06_C0012G0017 [Candidatus Woesebacteria bacterium GW2011_GWA1_38_8]